MKLDFILKCLRENNETNMVKCEQFLNLHDE